MGFMHMAFDNRLCRLWYFQGSQGWFAANWIGSFFNVGFDKRERHDTA
jgi:hypothetical protein